MQYIGKKIRKEKGMSRQELANISGISYQTLYQWESGLREPNVRQLKKVADALNTTIDSLFVWN